MNGFKLMADSYRKLVTEKQISEEDAKRTIEIYDFFSTCSKDDFYDMVDSSAFNDIIKAYCRKALSCANVNKNTSERVMDELRWLFDTMGAKTVCEPEPQKVLKRDR